jgi:uncharacterized protein (DUF1330 family)
MVAHIMSVPHVLSDPREAGPYYDGVAATMALYGGGYQSLPGHRVTTLEGAWHPAKGVAILEFPSYERAWARDHSPEYTPLRELRTTTGRNDIILVDGLGADDTERRARWAAMKRARSAELEAQEAHAQRGDRTDTT